MNDLYSRIENIYQKGFEFFKLNWKNIFKYTSVYYIISQIVSSIALVLALLISGTLNNVNSLSSLFNINAKLTNLIDTTDGGISKAMSFLGLLIVFVILALIIALPFLVNLYHSILQLSKKIVTPIFSFDKNYFKIIVNFVSYFVVVLLGALCFILPGIYLGVRLFPVLFLSVEEEIGLDEAFKKAWSLTDGNFWVIFIAQLLPAIAIGIMTSIITSASEINNFTGLIFTIPVIALGIFATAVSIVNSLNIYLDLKTQKNIVH
jgi:hypothetical protein